jgi:hypothetical protein
MRILFCDLQYSERGSFDDDIQAIRTVLTWAEIEYYKDNVKVSDLQKVAKLLLFLRGGRFDRVVFLSARLTVAFALSFLIRDLYCIYHFLPNSRKSLHVRLLRLMRGRVRFGVYGAGLVDQLRLESGIEAVLVPSRRVVLAESVKRYEQKARQKSLTVLVPGLRPGVREAVDIQKYVDGLAARGFEIGLIRVQGECDTSKVKGSVEKIEGYADAADYAELFHRSTFVIMHFSPAYELRCSGMVLDAVMHGCLVLTVAHPITNQYGFPRFPVVNLESAERLPSDAGSIREELLRSSIIFDHDFSEAWRKYLCS